MIEMTTGRAAQVFLASLARHAKQGAGPGLLAGGMVDLVNIEEAAERLSWGVLKAWGAWARARGRQKRAARTRYLRVCREVMRDIDAHTRGAAFRYDTPHGPLFNFDLLFEAAGRCGSHMGGAAEPTWPGWKPAAQAVA